MSAAGTAATVTPHNQPSAALASDGDGDFVLTYTADADGSTQLFQRDGFTINQ
ncbi:MAG: hypothetical protein ABI047_15630 [Jatrophihabitantaceae bacterium]